VRRETPSHVAEHLELLLFIFLHEGKAKRKQMPEDVGVHLISP
jgi:hypothetical protein